MPARLLTGIGSVGGEAGRARVRADGLSVAAAAAVATAGSGSGGGGGGGALALCPQSVEEVAVGLWLVRGVGLGFGAGAGAELVCVLLSAGLPNWAVGLAFDPLTPSRCPPSGPAAPGSVAAAGGLSYLVIDNVRDDVPGSLPDALAIVLACVGATLMIGGLFAL